MLVLSVLFLFVVTCLPPRFFISFSCRFIDIILSDGDSSFFLDTYSLSTSSLGCKASCTVMVFFFLFSGPFVEVLLWSTLRLVPGILQPRYSSLWWDFCYVVWSRVVFSFSWCIIFLFFLSFPHVWWCTIKILYILVNFLFFKRSDFFLVCYYFTHLKVFFTPALADGFSQMFEWLQISSSLPVTS